MPDVLIRDVDPDDLALIRAAAAARGVSLQAFLAEAVQARAAYLRRRTALDRAAHRLRGRPAVPEDARRAVLDAIERDSAERADEPTDRSPR